MLAAVIAYRRSWGACECEDLRRRVAVANRDRDLYLDELRRRNWKDAQ